jgi:phospholipid-binding lipoprotein MlaA
VAPVAVPTQSPASAEPLQDVPSGILMTSEKLPAATEAAPEAASAPFLDNNPVPPPVVRKGVSDPLEPINRISYAITQPIDRFILRPAAMVYKTVVPSPLRDGARNAITNFREPVVFLNDVVQLRPKRALRTLGRLIINSTLGLGGLFDIAKRKPFNLPHHNNGFGDSLGYYGIGPIMYLYLPVFGPGTLRDSAAQYGDSYFQDRILHKIIHPESNSPFFRTTPRVGQAGTIITVVDGLDQRAEHDAELKAFKNDSIDPYAALRSNYLQDRAGEIAELKAKDGEVAPIESFDDPLADPDAKAPVPVPAKP